MVHYTKVLHNRFCSFKVSKNFGKGIFRFKNNFLAADYPQKFVEKIIRNFENDKVNDKCFYQFF